MKRIAVVDDDITTRSLIKMLLEMEGYQVITLSTELEDIVFSLINEQPLVLFIDVHLHNQNGLEIVRNIRCRPELDTLLILMTSGMDVEEKCINVGANGFLLKPFMPNELINWLRSNLNPMTD